MTMYVYRDFGPPLRKVDQCIAHRLPRPQRDSPRLVSSYLSVGHRWLAFGGAMISNVAAASRGVLAKVSDTVNGYI